MFKKGKDNGRAAGSAPTANGNHDVNRLASGTELEGTVRANSDFRVDGKITGTLHCDAKVIIGPGGRVDGEIVCQNAMVEGTFTGKIHVKELLNIRENATVQGEVRYGKLNVQPDAVLAGDVQLIGSTTDRSGTLPGAKTLSSNGSTARQKQAVS